MKVKKRKEQWEAARYDGSGIPEEIERDFPQVEVHDAWGYKYLRVSRYNADKREWEDFDVNVGMYLVWSTYGKVKVLDQEDFEEKFEDA